MCEMLKDKLNEKKIEFVTVSDVNSILAKGIQNVPVLEVNNELLDTRNMLTILNVIVKKAMQLQRVK